MERQEKINVLALQLFQERLLHNRETIARRFQEQRADILEDLGKCVERLLRLPLEQPSEQDGKPVRYVAVAYLLSSAITGTFDFQLTLLDEEYYLDDNEYCVYWSPKFLFVDIEAEKKILYEAVSKEVIRLRPYELDTIWRVYVSEFYYLMAGMFFTEHLKEIALNRGLNRLELAEEVSFVYGGLMERGMEIDVWKGAEKETC